MGLISKSKTWVDNENLLYTDLNTMFTTLYNLVNGSIQNANIASDAAISASKLNMGTTYFTRGVLSLATADISAGTGKDEFTVPATVPSGKIVIESVELELDQAPGTSKTLTVDLNKDGSSILSSVITITNTTSTILDTGNTPSDTTFEAGERFTIDIDTATSGISTERARVNIVLKQYFQNS
jgi:hypothetical protein